MCNGFVNSDGFETHRYENDQAKNAVQKMCNSFVYNDGFETHRYRQSTITPRVNAFNAAIY